MTDFYEGLNDPSPIARVLIFGYYDGATNGVFQLGEGGAVYRFDLNDQTYNPDGCDEREFELRPLPPDAMDRLAGVIGEHIRPNWPTWLPIWTFPSAEIEKAVNQQIDAVLDHAGRPEWHITTVDTVRFATLTAHALTRATAV